MVEIGAVGSQILTVLFYSFTIIFVGVFIGIFAYRFRKNLLFKDFVIIRSLDKNGNIQIWFDRGGVMKNRKTRNTFYQLKKDKKAMIGVDTIQHTFTSKGKKVVELYYHENGNYSSLIPKIDMEGVLAKYDDGKFKYKDSEIQYQITQADVDWGIEQFIAFQKAFTSQSKFMQLLPYIGITLMFIGLVIIGIYLIKAYPSLISGLQATAQHLENAARAQAGVIT